ncbi:hypothetical protein COLO4_21239 [Corchorus olitorius]|uniref:Uncharacterized protein n=1 Tax=Corchorus olitorius TaxID=93759 RepID=A0A1R3IUT2_9ROSI|nr:hypothetical protein COLO4_21239 [Corchorus olitorius]
MGRDNGDLSLENVVYNTATKIRLFVVSNAEKKMKNGKGQWR